MKIKIYSDPGHAWAEVPRALVNELGLDISHYSYQRGAHVYLEEDCDLSAFIAAYGGPVTFTEIHTDHDSKIRNYDPYRGA